MKISQKSSLNYVHAGLLILRIGIGIMFIFHGLPKLLSGPEGWESTGKAMSVIGINFLPAFWGFMAGLAEAAGGLLLIFGLAFVPATLLLAFTMLIAFLNHYFGGDGFIKYSHSLEAFIMFVSLALIGPGKYRFSKLMVK